MTKEEIRNLILSEHKKGNICFKTLEGIAVANLEAFSKQPLPDILYDLNRNETTILSFIDDPKWVNDYAMMRLLEYYRNRLDKQSFVTDLNIEPEQDKQYQSARQAICDECFNHKPDCPWRARKLESKCEYLSDVMYGYERCQEDIRKNNTKK